MNTPNTSTTTARLITMSMSYRRYFMTATAVATGIAMNERMAPVAATRLNPSRSWVRNSPVNVSVRKNATRATAAPNHLICWRSSPRDRRNRTDAEAPDPHDPPPPSGGRPPRREQQGHEDRDRAGDRHPDQAVDPVGDASAS